MRETKDEAKVEERWVRLPNAEYPCLSGLVCTACGRTVYGGWLLRSQAFVFRCLVCFDAARGK